MIQKSKLQKLYLVRKLSSKEIASKYNCSERTVNYWLNKFAVKKRTISEAIYQKYNPKGNPFSYVIPRSLNDMFLFGLGLGIFWGEGTKKGHHALRLSNSDPFLVRKYIEFLVKIYNVDKNRLRFQLQTYNDLNVDDLIMFWSKKLLVKKSQFYKSTILVRRGKGTYRDKMIHGVIIVIFNNMKLKSLISSHIAKVASV